MEPEISLKMLKNVVEKLRAKLFATTYGYSMVKFARLDDAFSEFFELEASPVEGQSLQQKDKKGEQGKAQKKIKKHEKPKDVGYFLVQKFRLEIFISAHARAKKVVVERKARCHVTNAFLSRLELIWPISCLKISKCPKNCVCGKKLCESNNMG